MGYFKRNVDRDRARRASRELHELAEAKRPWEAIPGDPPKAASLVRFATRDTHERSGRRRGIFSAAYDALDEADLDVELVQRLRTELDWFARNLPNPELDDDRAIFLFKSNATACMKQIWALLHALRDAGVWTEMQSFEKPGRVVYEDEHQVAVVPWAEETAL